MMRPHWRFARALAKKEGVRALVATVVLGAACACSPSFTIPLSGSATLPSGDLLTCAVLPVFSGFGGFDISQTQQFKNQGASKDNIQSVKLQSLVLTVTAPPGADLGFLRSLSFSAVDPSGSLPTVEVAHVTDFSGSPASVTMTIDGVDLAPYAVLPAMGLNGSAQIQRCPTQDTTVEASLVLEVTLKG